MIDYAKNVGDLPRQIQEGIDKLADELKRIDEKIAPVVETSEQLHPEEGLYNANLELKSSYIEQQKQAVIIQALVARQTLISASLELEVRRALAEAAAAKAEAKAEKARHAAEKAAKQNEADAEAKAAGDNADAAADRIKADADVEAARAKADADRAKADAKEATAAAALDAARAKAEAAREAARQDFESDRRAAEAKKQAALKKAEQEAIVAMIEALNAAMTAFKGSAATTEQIKTMKDDLEKEILQGPNLADGGTAGPTPITPQPLR